MKKFLRFLYYIVISVGIGSLPALLLNDQFMQYKEFIKPPLAPPSSLFPIVWTILFVLMGISAFLVYNSGLKQKLQALNIFYVQLFVNALWSVFFFGLNMQLFAFIWLLLLIVLVVVMLIRFYKVNKLAFYLQLPYLLWLLYAGYLNFGIYLLNQA